MIKTGSDGWQLALENDVLYLDELPLFELIKCEFDLFDSKSTVRERKGHCECTVEAFVAKLKAMGVTNVEALLSLFMII